MRWEESDPRQFVRVFAWWPVQLHSNPRKWVWLEWVYRWYYPGIMYWHAAYCLPEELRDYKYPKPATGPYHAPGNF